MLITAASCNKLVESVFPGEDITLGELVVTVPPIPFADSTFEFPAGTFTIYINTDSVIRATTAGVFGINSVSSVKVKQITMSVLNADSDNNLSAFKSFRIAISSNTQTNPQDILQIDIPATAFDSYTATAIDSPDITAYLQGTSITYTVYGRVRSTTTKTLNISSTVVVTAK
ncbi:hypothetical protein BH11BAC6_BH11BAC6_04120 [soil metagenome]